MDTELMEVLVTVAGIDTSLHLPIETQKRLENLACRVSYAQIGPISKPNFDHL